MSQSPQKYIFLSIAMLMSVAAMAMDVKSSSLKEKWAFDHMNPEKTQCVQVDNAWIKKASSPGIKCRTQSAGYSEKYPGPVIICEGKKFNQMIVGTKEICIDNLETEKSNAP